MRFLLFILCAGMLSLPMSSHATVVSVDPTGTAQTATEAGNTANNVSEGATQVSQYQKTMAAIGTYKSTVSDYMSKIDEYKKKALEQKEKMDKARADFVKYKQEMQEAVEIAKNPKGLVDNAINSAKGTLDSIKSQAEGMVNDAKNMAESTIDGAVGDITGQNSQTGGDTSASEDGNTDGQPTDTASENAGNGQSAQGSSDIGETESSGVSSGEDGAASRTPSASSGGTAQGAGGQTADDIVDEPAAQPSRHPMITDEAQAAEDGVKSIAKEAAVADDLAEKDAMASGLTAEKVSEEKALSVSKDVVVEKTGVRSEVSKAVSNVEKQIQGNADSLKTGVHTVQKVESVRGAAATGTVKMEKAAALNAPAKAELQAVQKIESIKGVPAIAEKTKATLDGASAVNAIQPVVAEKNMQLKKNVKNLQTERVKKLDKAKTPVKKLKLYKEDDELNATINKARPRRASFKTSYGYGHVSQSIPLAFASAAPMGEYKGCEAMENTQICRDSIGLFCEMDYEKAADKDAYDACLKKMNDLRFSKINEELDEPLKTFSGEEKTSIATADRDQAETEMFKIYAESIASAYLEALATYNDSLTFKENTVDPVLNQVFDSEQNNVPYIYQINEIVGDRINKLNKLWARLLLVDAYQAYVYDGVRTSDEDPFQTSTN